MKELLDTVQKANTLPKPTLIVIGILLLSWFGHFIWKSYLCESVSLEKEKKRLEIIKLTIEVEQLAGKSDSVKPTAVLKESPSSKLYLPRHLKKPSDLKAKAKPKWRRAFLTGGLTASLFPAAMMCYTILHLPPGTGAATLHSAVLIQSGFLAICVVIGALAVALLSRDFPDLPFEFMIGSIVGCAVFPLLSMLFGLIYRMWAVFVNVH